MINNNVAGLDGAGALDDFSNLFKLFLFVDNLFLYFLVSN